MFIYLVRELPDQKLMRGFTDISTFYLQRMEAAKAFEAKMQALNQPQRRARTASLEVLSKRREQEKIKAQEVNPDDS